MAPMAEAIKAAMAKVREVAEPGKGAAVAVETAEAEAEAAAAVVVAVDAAAANSPCFTGKFR